jgi:hypothetical protein
MTALSELLEDAESTPATFDISDVRRRVSERARRRSRRRAGATVIVLGVVGAVGALLLGERGSPVVDVTVTGTPATEQEDAEVIAGPGVDLLISTSWLLESLDGQDYESFDDGWGATSSGRLARPTIVFDAGGTARMNTGCVVVQFNWSGIDAGISLADPHVPRRVCGDSLDELTEVVVTPLERGVIAQLGEDEITFGGLTFAATRPLDLSRFDGWRLAAVDGEPSLVSAWINSVRIEAERVRFSVTSCDAGEAHELLLDTTGDTTVLAVAGSSDLSCDGTAPDPSQVETVRDVITSVPELAVVEDDVLITSNDHRLRFTAPTAGPREGLIGQWEAAYVNEAPAAAEGLSLDISPGTFLAEGCALGYGVGHTWEADSVLQLGEVQINLEYDCTRPPDPASQEAEALYALLLDEPRLRILPQAFVVDGATGSGIFTRRDEAGEVGLGEGPILDVSEFVEVVRCSWPAEARAQADRVISALRRASVELSFSVGPRPTEGMCETSLWIDAAAPPIGDVRQLLDPEDRTIGIGRLPGDLTRYRAGLPTDDE